MAARSTALDSVRVVLTGVVTVFHAVTELTFYLSKRESEALQVHPLGRLISCGSTAVDGFLFLTAVLTVGSLLARYAKADAAGKPPPAAEILDLWFRRIVQLMVPLLAFTAIYLLATWNGRHPDVALRNEMVLRTLPQQADPSLPPLTQRGNGAVFLPWLVLGLGNLAPFGGLIQQTWSLALQVQYHLTLPLLPYVFGALAGTARLCSRGQPVGTIAKGDAQPASGEGGEAVNAASQSRCRRWCCCCCRIRPVFTPRAVAIAACVALPLTSVARLVAFRKMHGYNPSGIAGFALDFWAYANTMTRAAPFIWGALAAALAAPGCAGMLAWLQGKTTDRRGLRAALVGAMCLNVVLVAAVNIAWKDALIQLQQSYYAAAGKPLDPLLVSPLPTLPVWCIEAAYVLARPGGILCSLAYAWVITCLQHGIPLLPLGRAAASSGAAVVDKRLAADASPASPRPASSPSRWSRLVAVVTPLTFAIYLTNSAIYEIFYGWPQRLHPCPALLPAQTDAISTHLMYLPAVPIAAAANASGVALADLPPAAAAAPLAESFAAARLAFADVAALPSGQSVAAAASAVAQLVRQASSAALTQAAAATRLGDSLYCSSADPGSGVQPVCSGICYSNQRPRYGPPPAGDAAGAAPAGPPAAVQPVLTFDVPPLAWVQVAHYAAACIAFTLAAAWCFHHAVEKPLVDALQSPTSRLHRVAYPFVVAYAVLCGAVFLPALLFTNGFVLSQVTLALDAM